MSVRFLDQSSLTSSLHITLPPLPHVPHTSIGRNMCDRLISFIPDMEAANQLPRRGATEIAR